MQADTVFIITWLTAIVTGSLVLVIWLGSKNLSSRLFALLALLDAVWIASFTLLHAETQSIEFATFLFRFQFYIGSVIAAVFYFFAMSFPEDKKPRPVALISLILLELLYIPVYFLTDAIVIEAIPIGGIQRWGFEMGNFWFLFDVPFFILWSVGLYALFKKFRHATDLRAKVSLKYMLIGLIVGIVPPSLFDIILPEHFGYFNLDWLGPITGIGWVSILSYSIIRYRQMNVKAVTAELFILVMAVLMFLNIFITGGILKVVGPVMTFIAFIAVGIFFIGSILKEARQKEELAKLNFDLKDLNEHLQEKVDEQTQEVKRAYEVEKKARIELEELDKAKDQFILTTQHHLRTPLTIIKGYLAVIKDSSNLPKEIASAAENISNSTEILSSFVNDLLEITEMKARKDASEDLQG